MHSWSRQHVIPSPLLPALWTLVSGRLLPVCEHPHKPHVCEEDVGPTLARTDPPDQQETSYFTRCFALSWLEEGGGSAPSFHSEPRMRYASTSSGMAGSVAGQWHRLGKPLQQVTNPDDASQFLWLCPAHAKELAPRDSGNVLRMAATEEAVDVYFFRWLRVGVGLQCVAKHLGAVLQQRVEQWYSATLAPEARVCVTEAVATQAASAAAGQQRKAQVEAMQALLKTSVEQALAGVDEEVTRRGGTVNGSAEIGVLPPVQPATPAGQKRVDKKEKPWTKWVKSLRSGSKARDPLVALTVLDWLEVAPEHRHFVLLKQPLRKVVQRRYRRKEWVDELLQLVRVAAAAHLESSGAWQTLVLKDAILVAPADGEDAGEGSSSDGDSDDGASDTKGVDSNESGDEETPALLCDGKLPACMLLPPYRGQWDPCQRTSSVCAVCRGWAKAIAARRRKPPTDDSWKNCITRLWSATEVHTACDTGL